MLFDDRSGLNAFDGVALFSLLTLLSQVWITWLDGTAL